MLQVNLPQVVAFLSSFVSISVAGVNIFNYPQTVLGLWDAWHISRVCTSHPALPGSNLTVSNPGTTFFSLVTVVSLKQTPRGGSAFRNVKDFY